MKNAIDYEAINKALAAQFGDGKVELRGSAKHDPFEFVLWFQDENAPMTTISAAKKIVAQFVPTHWRAELTR